jgi:hypothetical protein
MLSTNERSQLVTNNTPQSTKQLNLTQKLTRRIYIHYTNLVTVHYKTLCTPIVHDNLTTTNPPITTATTNLTTTMNQAQTNFNVTRGPTLSVANITRAYFSIRHRFSKLSGDQLLLLPIHVVCIPWVFLYTFTKITLIYCNNIDDDDDYEPRGQGLTLAHRQIFCKTGWRNNNDSIQFFILRNELNDNNGDKAYVKVANKSFENVAKFEYFLAMAKS